MVAEMVDGGFLGQAYAEMLQFVDRPQQIVPAVTAYRAPSGQWSGVKP